MGTTAVYVRVSTKQQDHRSQEPDLDRWVKAYAGDDEVTWYRDTATGKNMDRPGWRALEADIDAGKVTRIVVWRLDRLGRTASGLTSLFERLVSRKIGLVSMKDSLDLGTPAGRLMGNMLASVAVYETEVRAERVRAGQAAARAKGVRWGGSKKGRRLSVTDDQIKAVRTLKQQGEPVAAIARAVGLSRTTVYGILQGADAA